MHQLLNLGVVTVLAVACCACAVPATQQTGQSRPSLPPATTVRTYDILNEYPHDPAAFTQGLTYSNGSLFESTGLHGQSTLREVQLETGTVVRTRSLESQHFAEGLTLWHGQLIQLTLSSRLGFVYDIDSFETIRTFRYEGEGWGLTHDGERLIVSDGTATLRFLDPTTFSEVSTLLVRDGRTTIERLNELEFVNGQVYANIWGSDRLAIIDPKSGIVAAWLDFKGLLPPEARRRVDVLNGIAYDADGHRLFITGKLWPRLYEIRIRDEITTNNDNTLDGPVALGRHHALGRVDRIATRPLRLSASPVTCDLFEG